jgi:pimeloyl-ACP methyl ester carboxylesterase
MRKYLLLCYAYPSPFLRGAKTLLSRFKNPEKEKPFCCCPALLRPDPSGKETVRQMPSKHQMHVFTYAGFGGTAPIDTPLVRCYQKDLLLYIKKEKLSHFTIIGHSMGGTLAMDIAAALPDKVDKIVLVDALPCMRDLMMPNVSADKILYNSPYNQQVLDMKPEAFQQMAAMMAGGMTAKKDKADTIQQWILTADRNTYVYGYTDLLKLDLRPELARIQAKVMIIGATFPTKEVAKATMEKQFANLKSKEIIMAPDSRHFIMFDQPEWFYAQVNAFLKQ